ncbi:DUF4129 domain-containing protein [Gorillibacterium sp. CAU 1737]|uniref:DUF4129 domain-containing protein n=1 Tax=Gorillibacterium sp. CAU 1737 TaxID=3140362 RepID=UPI003261864B
MNAPESSLSSLPPAAVRRAMSPAVYLGLEGFVLLSGLLLFAGVITSDVERWVLLLFVPFLLLVGTVMNQAYRRYGEKAAFLAGSAIAAGSAFGVLFKLTDTGFLVWTTVLVFVLVGRFGLWLADQVSPEERFRGYFIWESCAVPILVLIAFRQSEDPSFVLAAVIFYLAFRGFSLVYAQRTVTGSWSFRLRGVMLLFVIVAGLIPLIMVFPAVSVVLGYLGVPVIRLLTWLTRNITVRPAPEQDPLAGEGLGNPDRQLWPETQVTDAGGIPDSVWIGLLILAILLLLAIRIKNRRMNERDSAAPVQVQINRTPAVQTSAKRLKYSTSGKGIRAVYRELLGGMEQKGEPVRAHETARDYTRRIALDLPPGQVTPAELDELVEQYEQVRYGGDPLSAPANPAAEGSAERLRRAENLVQRLVSLFPARTVGKDEKPKLDGKPKPSGKKSR